MPWSRTAITTRSFSVRARASTKLPAGEYLTAFEVRLLIA
jgi:hypothetical protein